MDDYSIARAPWRITCPGDVPRELAGRWLEECAGWFPSNPSKLARARSTRVAFPGGQAIAKRAVRPLLKRLADALGRRDMPLKRAFKIGLHLRQAGVRAPRALALIERRRWGLAREAILLLEAIEGVTLRAFILRDLPAAAAEPRPGLKEALWTAIALEVARLHAAGVRQRDLKAPNIMVAGSEPGERRVEVSFVDLDGMSLLGAPPPPRKRRRDLARLLASLREAEVAAVGVGAADWEFLVSRYLEAAPGAPARSAAVEDFIDATCRWARRKEARNQRRRRPLR